MTHLWSGRLSGDLDRDAFDFQVSFPFDRRLFEDDVVGSLAWTEALARAGVLDGDEADAIANALVAILAAGRENAAFVDGADEDVHSFVERKLIERIGDGGKRLHTGRSRNEQVSLDLRLYLRRAIARLQTGIRRVAAACVARAESAGDAVMPAFTHLRRAQPILVAHYFGAHVSALRRDHERFDAAAHEADVLPLGSGAVAGASYAIDTSALALRLGFSRVAANSLDATSDRDFVVVFLQGCALTMVHLSRLAEDLIIFTSEEFAFFDLADAVATGSSLMPQKKNPDPLELVRGKTGRTIGTLAGFLATLKGLPSGYNKDLQEDKEAVFDAEESLFRSLHAVSAVVETLTLNIERVERAASGLLLATDVADYLVGRGMPFRRAHEVVGALAGRLASEGRDFTSLSSDEWRAASDLFADDVRERVTARASVQARRTPQSTHPDAVAASLEDARAWLSAHEPREDGA